MSWLKVTVLVTYGWLFQSTLSENTFPRRPTAPVSALQRRLLTCFCPRSSPLIIPYPYLQPNGRKSRINYARDKPTTKPKINEGQLTGYIFRLPICINRPVETNVIIKELPLSIFTQSCKESSSSNKGNTLNNPSICTDTNEYYDDDQDILRDKDLKKKKKICSEEIPKSKDLPTDDASRRHGPCKDITADKEDAPETSRYDDESTKLNDDIKNPVQYSSKDTIKPVNYIPDDDSKNDTNETTKEMKCPVENESPIEATLDNTNCNTKTDNKEPKKVETTEVPGEDLCENKASAINNIEPPVEFASPKDDTAKDSSSATYPLCYEDATRTTSFPEQCTDKKTVNDQYTILEKYHDENEKCVPDDQTNEPEEPANIDDSKPDLGVLIENNDDEPTAVATHSV